MKIDSLKKLYANYHNIKIVWFNVSHVITCDSMSCHCKSRTIDRFHGQEPTRRRLNLAPYPKLVAVLL